MKKKTKNKIINVILDIIIILLLFLVGLFGYKYWDSKKISRDADKDQKIAMEAIEESKDEENKFTIDWNYLMSQNPDTKMWLKMPDEINISRVVVKTDNNEYYLTHGFVNDGSYGTTFASYLNVGDIISDQTTVLYDHMWYGEENKGFSNLTRLKNQDVFNRNQTFDIYTPEHKFTFKIFSVSIQPANGTLASYFSAFTQEEFDDYINQAKADSLVSTDYFPKYGDRLVTLYTCTEYDSYDRLIVNAGLVAIDDIENK